MLPCRRTSCRNSHWFSVRQKPKSQLTYVSTAAMPHFRSHQINWIRYGAAFRVEFLDAEAAFADNLTLSELLAAIDPETKAIPSRFGSGVAQRAAEFLAGV